MSAPRNVFSNFPSPRILQSPLNLGVQDHNTQDEDEDLGSFETEVVSDDEGYMSNEEVPKSTSARRFKETLSEPKPPRVKQHSHAKSRSGEVDTDFVLSKLTPGCLSRDHRQFCCTKTCVWNLGIKTLRHEPEAIEALQLHRKQQAEERAAAGRRRWKALDTLKDCAYIQIDGQKKTALPHFSKQPKFVDGTALVGVHLVGAMQEDIGRNIGRSIRERLTGDMCWLWPMPLERDAEEVELLAVTTAEDLRRRVFGIRRPIYSGPRKPPPGSVAADRAAHIGELTEIDDKSFLAVLAEDDVSFRICQVLKINGRNEAGEPTKVMIQWYATEDSNPYTGKFYPEKRRSNGKGRPVLFRQEVNLDAVTILSFNFIFTTTRRLRKITERQIRTGLFKIARDKEVSVLDGNISPASDVGSADDEETDCSGPDSDPDE
ncbi:hypothetical protein R1sor_021582 [Riccia sorocarpa]|uniref:BAH domain-containing protein n=1 Tax=Riccia sorocarpa TaxID=122646 RepID=A0ABD3GL74_9MARC